jgi:hypothetical protein
LKEKKDENGMYMYMSIANNYLNVITEDNITPYRNSMNQFGNCRYLHYFLLISLNNCFAMYVYIHIYSYISIDRAAGIVKLKESLQLQELKTPKSKAPSSHKSSSSSCLL